VGTYGISELGRGELIVASAITMDQNQLGVGGLEWMINKMPTKHK